jgi:hypothetical protein
LQNTVTLQIAGNVGIVNRVGYTINVEIVDFKEAMLIAQYILEKRPELDLS